MWNNKEIIISWRGTEPKEWKDITADLKFRKQVGNFGKVHRGFKGYVDKIWPQIEKRVKELTKGKGAEAVIDFVGEKGSTPMGIKMTKATGTFYIVGYGEEIRVLAIDMIDQEKSIVGSLVGTWAELYELMELADKGLVKLSMKEYKLEEANKALHDLNDGKIKGRAVLVP